MTEMILAEQAYLRARSLRECARTYENLIKARELVERSRKTMIRARREHVRATSGY